MRGVCLGVGYLWFLSLFWVILDWFLFPFSPRIGQSNTNFCWVLQCRYRFRNWQPKTMPLSIQKLAAKTTDSEISNENCIVADSESAATIASLPIQKSAARNYVTVDSEIGSNGGVISALLLFFCVYMPNSCSLRLGTWLNSSILDLAVR